MDAFVQDLRFGLRMLLKNPGFTAVAVLALGLGIGANTAIFSVINAVLIRPLPYRNPQRLVMVWENNLRRARDRNVISPANFLDWQDQNRVFEQMASFYDFRVNLTGVGDPEELPAQAVTTNLFPLLGVNPLLGRSFSSEESRPGHDNVIILSYGLWQRRFGSDPTLLGRSLQLNGQSMVVIGVMPPDFQLFIKAGSQFGKQPELWTPIVFTAKSRIRSGRYMTAVARLGPGITLHQARSEMNRIAAQLAKQFPDFDTGWGINLVPLQEEMVGEIRPGLLVLFVAVGFVLLIACANVANLLLARAAARHKEIAIRAALGAGRRRLVCQLLTESALMAGTGGVFGYLLASWGVDFLLSLIPKDLAGLESVRIDYQALGFTLLVTFLTGLLFGLVPALFTSGMNPNESLKEGGRDSTSETRRHGLRGAFVIAEVALALVLLVGSGLLLRSFVRLQAVDPGFNPKNMLTVRLLLPMSKYREDRQVVTFFHELLQRVRALPGVRSASANSFLPFSGLGAATGFTIEGRPTPAAGEKPVLDVRVIDPDFFRTMGIPILRGRTFTEREATEVSHVAVINATMAHLYWPDEDPIGKRVTIEMKDSDVPSEIIGVVGDVKHVGLDSTPRPMAYWPHPELAISFMTLVIRTDSDPLGLAGAVRQVLATIDKDQPIGDLSTMERMLSDSIARARFNTLLLSLFAGLALALAAVGIYGVISYSVASRTREIGIRMALGAAQQDVLKMVVRQGMMLTLSGVGIGIVFAIGLTRFLRTLLFGLSPTDPVTYLAIALLLSAVAMVACYLPAYRATQVDPMVALRDE